MRVKVRVRVKVSLKVWVKVSGTIWVKERVMRGRGQSECGGEGE